jgi:hypothetical protein
MPPEPVVDYRHRQDWHPAATLVAVFNVSGQATTASGRGRSYSDGFVESLTQSRQPETLHRSRNASATAPVRAARGAPHTTSAS